MTERSHFPADAASASTLEAVNIQAAMEPLSVLVYIGSVFHSGGENRRADLVLSGEQEPLQLVYGWAPTN